MSTQAEWHQAQARTSRGRALSGGVGVIALGALSVPGMVLGTVIASGVARYLVSAGIIIVLMSPIVGMLVWVNEKSQRQADAKARSLAEELSEAVRTRDLESLERDSQATRQQFESRLANALEMAEGEPEVIDVIERAFAFVLPESPVELLLADNSHAHLLRMATASPAGSPPGCGVDSPDHCPAARRAQVQHFPDSDHLDACPKLRGRLDGPVSAVCVPVSIMGRTVGVIHATGEPGASPGSDEMCDLGALAGLAGARIGLLRVMAETQLQAATDSLTGHLNRRSFEQKLSVLRRDEIALTVGIADLDHFKTLNDTFGHETGDRALRLFAQVLTESVRAQDLVCRHGGEEFVIALPGCAAAKARQIFDVLRARLDAAITVAGLPHFTVSVGVVDAGAQEDLPAIIGRADAALFGAKRGGRNQVMVHDAAGNALDVAIEARALDLLSADNLTERR